MTQTTFANVLRTGKDPAYSGLLGDLRRTATRETAAGLVAQLSSTADDIAGALTETGIIGEAEEDTGRDPIAWTDIATHLTRISLALPGGTLDTADWEDDSDEDNWKRLSEAADHAGFAAAWEPIRASLIAKAVPAESGGKSPLREFTVTQVLAVADAVLTANW